METAEFGRSSIKTVSVEERASEEDMARKVTEASRKGNEDWRLGNDG